jgi:uncharacterized MAPEG superfamily protein
MEPEPMTPEMKLLLWSVALGLLQCLATGFAVSGERGIGFSAGARDDQKPVEGVGGRVIRAFANFKETYVFFVALVLVGQVLDRHSVLTVLGANLYVWARILYWPLYSPAYRWSDLSSGPRAAVASFSCLSALRKIFVDLFAALRYELLTIVREMRER